MNMKNIIKMITMMVIITSCTKESISDDPTRLNLVCGTKNPMIDLPWLVEKMKMNQPYTPEGMGVVLFEYEGNKVVEIQSFLSSSSNIHQYFCDGTKLDFESTSENVKRYKDYVLNRKEISIIYGKKCLTFYPQF